MASESNEMGAAVDIDGKEVTEEPDLTAESELELESDPEPSSIELSADDVASLAKKNNVDEIDYERVGTHKFVKFADVLPPAPPRGAFDVRRIKDSAYFFS